MEVHIYRYYIKVTVAEEWGVFTNVNTDDVNHLCSTEHRDEHGRIWKPITGKINIKDNLKGFRFDYVTQFDSVQDGYEEQEF